MDIRGIIAFDLDDSLLNHDLTIAAEDRAACREAIEDGFKLVLASGRNEYSMTRYARELGLDSDGGRFPPGEFLICSNGAEIIELSGPRRVYSRKLDRALVGELEAFARAAGHPIQAYEEGKIFVTAPNRWSDEDTRLTGQPNVAVRSVLAALPDDGAFKLVIPGDADALARLLPVIARRFEGRIRALTSKPIFLEILPVDADKGIALKRLASSLGVDRGAVMAMGDARNDLGMVTWAGFGCAPSNAIAEVKAAARYASPFAHGRGAARDCILAFLRYLDLRSSPSERRPI
jgi:hypothetical protein